MPGADKAHRVLSIIKENRKKGIGPQSLAAIRDEAAQKRLAAEKEAAEESASTIMLQDFFEHYYIPDAKRTKSSWLNRVSAGSRCLV